MFEALDRSKHWNEYHEKLAAFEDMVSEGIMPLELIKEMLEELNKMKN